MSGTWRVLLVAVGNFIGVMIAVTIRLAVCPPYQPLLAIAPKPLAVAIGVSVFATVCNEWQTRAKTQSVQPSSVASLPASTVP